MQIDLIALITLMLGSSTVGAIIVAIINKCDLPHNILKTRVDVERIRNDIQSSLLNQIKALEERCFNLENRLADQDKKIVDQDKKIIEQEKKVIDQEGKMLEQARKIFDQSMIITSQAKKIESLQERLTKYDILRSAVAQAAAAVEPLAPASAPVREKD